MSATTSHGRHVGVRFGSGGAGDGRFACGGTRRGRMPRRARLRCRRRPDRGGARGDHRRGRRGPWRGRRARRGHGGRARRGGRTVGCGAVRATAGVGVPAFAASAGITNGRARVRPRCRGRHAGRPGGGGLGSDDGQQCRRKVAAVGSVRCAVVAGVGTVRGGVSGGVGFAVAPVAVPPRSDRSPWSARSPRLQRSQPSQPPRRGHRRRGGHRGHVEQLRVLAAQVQHGRDPLERSAAHAEDADPSAPHGFVDPATVRERGVEAAGELDGGGVADRELHRGDGPDAAVRERGGRAREEVGRAARTRLARVQHDEARRRLRLVEEVGEARRAST